MQHTRTLTGKYSGKQAVVHPHQINETTLFVSLRQIQAAERRAGLMAGESFIEPFNYWCTCEGGYHIYL